MRTLLQWLKANSVLIVNAGSLVGTTAVTSGLGFVYWWIAARQFPSAAVGMASAWISAMTLLGGLCMLGLGTLLITELPRQSGREGALVSTALLVVGGVSACVGITFAVVAGYISPGFQPLVASTVNMVIFAGGIVLTSVTLVLDQALLGLLRGDLQFWRNALFAVVKLATLLVVAWWATGWKGGVTIYTTWAIGNILSLLMLAVVLVAKGGWSSSKLRPQWGLLRKLGFSALQHHLLNLALQAPALILPVLVTILLSATMNAWFYIAWMIAGVVFLIPSVLTIVLHAMNSAQQTTISKTARVTIGLSLGAGLLANILLQPTAKLVLGVFGSLYADQAAWCLRVLLLAVFPIAIKNHYISICRIYDRVLQAMLSMLPGCILELAMAVVGGYIGGLTGLSIGWVGAISIESLFMLPTVYKTIFSSEQALQPVGREHMGAQAPWQTDTSPLPIISPSYLASQRSGTISMLPAMKQEYRIPRRSQQPLQGRVSQGYSRKKPGLKPSQLLPYKPQSDHASVTNHLSGNENLGEGIHNSTISEGFHSNIDILR